MNKRLLSVLIFGLVVSGIASFVLYRLISARMVASANVPTTPIVIATHDLQLGALVKDADVKVIGWTGTPPQGASSRQEDIVGRGVVATIISGEPIIESRLAPKGAGAGLASTIPPGMRAVALSVNDVVGVAGFVVPGMRVDVVVSGNPPGAASATTGMQTRTLLQNIVVLSAGQNIQKDAEGKPIPVQVVNLLVTPDQAETLSLASQETRVRLVLRNPMDNDVAKTSGTAVANLFGSNIKPVSPEAHAPRVPHAARPVTVPVAVQVKPEEKVVLPFIVEIIHGTRKTEVKFQPEEAKQ
jgi:pilus assembly protein CpaB